ncbi:MAG: type II toxin-antitoxin system HicB family antitoxin [Solirubrobacterales bacterium]
MSEGSMTKLTARIHAEDGSYWADVPELPGVFATGDTLDELFDSLREGVVLVMGSDSGTDSVQLERAVISIG